MTSGPTWRETLDQLAVKRWPSLREIRTDRRDRKVIDDEHADLGDRGEPFAEAAVGVAEVKLLEQARSAHVQHAQSLSARLMPERTREVSLAAAGGTGLLPVLLTPPSAYVRRFLVTDRTQISQCRVPTLSIVEPLDVVKYIRSSLVPSDVLSAVRALYFQRRKEAFHCSVIPAVTASAHAAGHSMRGK